MTDKDDPKLLVLLYEYNELGDMRRQHMGAYLQTNFYLGVLIVIIGGSLSLNHEWALLIAPLIVFIQLSIVQWNQYHHFLIDEYICWLEKQIRDSSGIGNKAAFYHEFYRSLFFTSTYLKARGSSAMLIKPTALLSINLAVFNLLVVVFCVWYGRTDFVERFGTWGFNGYVGLLAVLLCLLLYNFVMMPKHLRTIIKDKLEDFVAARAGGSKYSAEQ